MLAPQETAGIVLSVRNLETRYGERVIHAGIDLDVRRSEILAIVGGSGSGKSTLLRELILLKAPDSGSIRMFGTDPLNQSVAGALALRLRWGVMFQHGGLFAALTVTENIGLPLREHTQLSDALIDRIAAWKLAASGLEPEVGSRYPPELSGGMLKRASLARALALDPELLFLDEPTAGLDPESAAEVDALILSLQHLHGLTIVMISHDLDTLWRVADRVAILADGRIQAIGSMAELSTMPGAAIRPFFDGPRARAAYVQHHPEAAPAASAVAPERTWKQE